VVLGGMGMLAMTLTSCGSDPDRRCVDPATHRKLPDYKCESGGGGRYYYGGSVSKNKVSKGSFDKSAVDRGGFGGIFSGGG
jgi:hypothetical protein